MSGKIEVVALRSNIVLGSLVRQAVLIESLIIGNRILKNGHFSKILFKIRFTFRAGDDTVRKHETVVFQ